MPAASAGAVIVSEVEEVTDNAVPATVPNFTPVTPMKPVPVTVTTVPPANFPAAGDTAVTVGAATYVKRSAVTSAEVPPAAVTRKLTVPAACAGAVIFSEVEEVTVNAVPATVPNFTPVTPVKPVPVTVTTAPPANLPAEGDNFVTVGAAAAAAGDPADTTPKVRSAMTNDARKVR